RQSIFMFFFSSRRRHTRFSRDWSSDVCSSDLRVKQEYPGIPVYGLWHTLHVSGLLTGARFIGILERSDTGIYVHCQEDPDATGRSEERRVGKECGAGRGLGRGERGRWAEKRAW